MKGEVERWDHFPWVRLLGALALALVVGCGGESDDDASNANQGSGGDAGSGGTGGDSGGASGASSGGSGKIPELPEGPPSSVDLLFVIDNSISMGEKQDLLAEAIPGLLRRFIEPRCVDASGTVVGQSQNGACASGELEFPAVDDLHLGVITSSLGSHGGDVCLETPGRHNDDKARLVASLRDLPSWNDAGFLAWDPSGTANTPPGESNAETLLKGFTDHVRSAGEAGCGYEATLEAWYRFLVDPEPPASVSKANDLTVREGVDETVLAQRKAFLRSDSLLYIVMLTDENDCSIVDYGLGWLVGAFQKRPALPPASTACASDPNDPCCRSCALAESTPPSGCAPLNDDPACQDAALPVELDTPNLRCWDQKRRFGFDLLYPIERYVNGLTSPQVLDASGRMVENPLFTPRGGRPGRHPAHVVLAGIVGVPWQDIATTESLMPNAELTFLRASELREQGRWDIILGDPRGGIPPADPLMIESNKPRTGTHPITLAPLAPADSIDPQQNPINGHEVEYARQDDLQYACIFPLAKPRDCTDPELLSCPCAPGSSAENSPVCQPPGGGEATTTQYYAKVYPALRHLDLLKRLGDGAIVTSACPKTVTGDKDDPSYGYNPVARAIIDQTRALLRGN
jgi:hypothetical protein